MLLHGELTCQIVPSAPLCASYNMGRPGALEPRILSGLRAESFAYELRYCIMEFSHFVH